MEQSLSVGMDAGEVVVILGVEASMLLGDFAGSVQRWTFDIRSFDSDSRTGAMRSREVYNLCIHISFCRERIQARFPKSLVYSCLCVSVEVL